MDIVLMFLVCGVIAALAGSRAPRRGCRVNDLRRWKQYGGTLERPKAPVRFRAPQSKEDAA